MWALRHKNRHFTLSKSSISIGQGKECDVVIKVSVRQLALTSILSRKKGLKNLILAKSHSVDDGFNSL